MFFFFNDTATAEIYPLSLHDALPIWRRKQLDHVDRRRPPRDDAVGDQDGGARADHRHSPDGLRARDPDVVDIDRKSTRLNSSHANISYAVFCLKKKTQQ